ncbi:TonB-dependent receptor plug domain-containing protein [Sphingobacterium sp. E70]|uniref:TonB-dependent receptor plug domain-containing protein n=1 Tax=Sphingobacterium sp. E70 TaxID=2853439 RepID=UPI00211BF687|nr:TonB-dependent receptor plug domain-containing protein [Sphingobacterium sp. E70]ULT25157.1 TonB-dependent receptor plug domain-containing protein [Sphingobacterium sp. E70]
MNGYLVLVDGFPRDANNVMPTEIEQISVLKGVNAIALYGSRAAKGVISISTKRGKAGGQQVKIRANAGVNTAISYPKYLGSAEYMTLYNEARQNDGLSPLYSAETIYQHAAGTNPFRYPNVDYYASDYIKDHYNRYDATAEISGAISGRSTIPTLVFGPKEPCSILDRPRKMVVPIDLICVAILMSKSAISSH